MGNIIFLPHHMPVREFIWSYERGWHRQSEDGMNQLGEQYWAWVSKIDDNRRNLTIWVELEAYFHIVFNKQEILITTVNNYTWYLLKRSIYSDVLVLFLRRSEICYADQLDRQENTVWASVAQMVELLICNQWVGGSSPSAGSTDNTGGVPERPKGTDCKSVGEAFGGSNPPPTTNHWVSWM